MCKHIIANRAATLHFTSTAYEIIIWTHVFTVLFHASQLEPTTILFLVLQLIFVIITKVHLAKHFTEVLERSGHLSHALITDQLQNITVAVLAVLSNIYISFSPVALILFSSYLISSVIFMESPKYNPQFKITEWMVPVQYVAASCLFILIQGLKCMNMWRSSIG